MLLIRKAYCHNYLPSRLQLSSRFPLDKNYNYLDQARRNQVHILKRKKIILQYFYPPPPEIIQNINAKRIEVNMRNKEIKYPNCFVQLNDREIFQ